jgi:ankyrin repeat protein
MSRLGQLEIVLYLVEHRANVAHRGFEGKTPLHCACFGVNFSPAERGKVLEGGASITETDNNGKCRDLRIKALLAPPLTDAVSI